MAGVAWGAYQYGINQGSEDQNPIACTEDAKICPDGSSVGRSGPSCDFAECPETEDDRNSNVVDVTSLKVGDIVAGMTVVSIEPFQSAIPEVCDESGCRQNAPVSVSGQNAKIL